MLSLPARGGGQVAVHPLHFALLTGDPQVREFQVIQDGPLLRILVVPRISTSPPRQPPTTNSRRGLAKPLPSNSHNSAHETRRSPSSVATSWPDRPAANSSS